MVRSSFLVALQTVYQSLQLLLKRDFSKFQEKLLFGIYILDFSTELQNAEVSVALLRSDSTTALPAILKILGTKETLASKSVFGVVIGGWIWQLEFFKRNATKDVFLVIFQNFHKSSFSNILSKMYEDILLEAFS